VTKYLRRLKERLVGDAHAPLVYVCNFEAERQWAGGHVGLPGVRLASAPAVVQRMEELGALLAGPEDYLLVKHGLDDGYLRYAEELGFAPPTVLRPENVAQDRSTTEDALDSPGLLGTLAELGTRGARLLPMGTSVLEQKLSETCALPLAGPPADTAERVNSKIYSRRQTGQAGLREVPGHCCETVSDFAVALRSFGPDRPLVVKDAYGVSGRGLVVLDSPAKVARILRMVERRAERTGDDRLEVVVEHWLTRRCDLNYQLTVAADGAVTFDFVKVALTESGVHKGHIVPAELDSGQLDEIRNAADLIGGLLYRDGFTGVAGIDAVVGADGTLYPVLEINARLNMSTYQGGVTELMQPPGYAGLARHYTLRLGAVCSFDQIRAALDQAPREAGARTVVTCFGTLNAAAPAAGQAPFDGRLYVMLFARDRARLGALDASTQQALARIPDVVEVR
jgi:Pre ATP-grasp domain/ATP-grasp domain